MCESHKLKKKYKVVPSKIGQNKVSWDEVRLKISMIYLTKFFIFLKILLPELFFFLSCPFPSPALLAQGQDYQTSNGI
jgi:hypothetical protein